MNTIVPISNKQLIKDLKKQVSKLQTELKKVSAKQSVHEQIQVKVQKSQGRYKKLSDNPKGIDLGIGEFFLLLDITAATEAVYIPLSIASGKKATGFIYQIEGTAKGTISSTDITARGSGVTLVTLGTLLYCKIPKGKKATFRILIHMKGQKGKSYTVAINRINYKLAMDDARYQRYEKEIRTRTLEFR